MAVIYIAGPIQSEDPLQRIDNCEAGIKLAFSVAKLGHAAFCPHALALDQEEYDEATGMTEDDWMDVDLQALGRSDAVVFASGWTDSPGCRREHAFAVQRRIPIFYSIEMLECWLEGK